MNRRDSLVAILLFTSATACIPDRQASLKEFDVLHVTRAFMSDGDGITYEIALGSSSNRNGACLVLQDVTATVNGRPMTQERRGGYAFVTESLVCTGPVFTALLEPGEESVELVFSDDSARYSVVMAHGASEGGWALEGPDTVRPGDQFRFRRVGEPLDDQAGSNLDLSFRAADTGMWQRLQQAEMRDGLVTAAMLADAAPGQVVIDGGGMPYTPAHACDGPRTCTVSSFTTMRVPLTVVAR